MSEPAGSSRPAVSAFSERPGVSQAALVPDAPGSPAAPQVLAALTRPLMDLGDAPSRSRLLPALRRMYLLGLLALSLPGVLIGLPLGLLGRPQPGLAVLAGLGVAALLCSGLALTLAHRKARAAVPGTLTGRDSALQAATQAASAPAAPLLMALAMLRTPGTALALLALTLLTLALGWVSLRLWASRAGLPDLNRRGPGRSGSDQPDPAAASPRLPL